MRAGSRHLRAGAFQVSSTGDLANGTRAAPMRPPVARDDLAIGAKKTLVRWST